jgi:hypothetical protein
MARRRKDVMLYLLLKLIGIIWQNKIHIVWNYFNFYWDSVYQLKRLFKLAIWVTIEQQFNYYKFHIDINSFI